MKISKSVMMTGLITVSLTATAFLSGCAGSSKEQNHAIIGSVLGGAAGHQFGKGKGKTVMTILGAVAGGMIGGQNGRRMDQEDRNRVSQTLETAPNYRKVAWENPETKTNYEFTPVNTYEGNVNGQRTTCRDYVMDAYIDGRMQQVNGRACKNGQGQWVNTN
jgi:surface antigen